MKQFLFAAIAAFALQTAFAQNPDTVTLTNRQSILNDRAFFQFPDGAQNMQREVNIMAAASPNVEEETRIVYTMGDMMLVFFAQELFLLADENLVSSISSQNATAQINTKVLTDSDGLLSILCTPTQFDSTASAIFINGVLVKTQDSTIFRLNAFINPAAFILKDQFQALTEKVFATISKGTRTNNRAARQEIYALFGTEKSLTFNLPANYSITVDQQHDFQVFKFHKYKGLEDPAQTDLLIYNGFHPSPVYGDLGLTESDAQKTTGKFLGKEIDWLFFDLKDEGMFVKEQLIPFDDIDKGMIIHVAMITNQPQALDELTKIAEGVQITK